MIQKQEIESTLRDIHRQKKLLTMGNIPNSFHLVAHSLGMAEGMLRYGFENSLNILTNKNNWNVRNLGGRVNAIGEVECDNKPRMSFYKVFTREGFEIHAIPWRGNREFNCELSGFDDMDYKFWNPKLTRVVFRIAHLHQFIKLYFDYGDEADLALIRFAHNIVEDFVDYLTPQFNTKTVYGISVRSFFEFAEKRHKAGSEMYLPTVYDLQEDELAYQTR